MTLFGITSIITFFTSIGFALIIYFGDRKSKLNKSWLLFSLFIALWSILLYKVVSSPDKETALFWQYLLDITAIFIPVLYLNFTFDFLKISNFFIRKIVLFLGVFLSLFSFTPFFKKGVVKIFNFYWVEPGKFYLIFPIFFISLILISTFFLIKAYIQTNKNLILHGQIRNQLLASAIGFSAGITNFFPQLFNIYPFGNYFIILYIFFVSYAVLKYKFLSKKIISTQLFSGAIILVLLFNLLKPAESIKDWSLKFILFIVVLFFILLLNKSMYKEIQTKKQLQKLADNLKKANIKLKKMDKQKSEFVSIASHQLRAPIASLKGYSSMILEGSYGTVPKRISDVVQKLFQSSQSLSLIIDGFLNLSRIERGKIEYNFSQNDLKDIVKEAISISQPLAKEKGLKLITDITKDECRCDIDANKIRQMCINIINNAIKYTPKGSVHIKLLRDKEKLLLEISDTGIGIPKNEISSLFKKFHRLSNANGANIKGTGLGLYLAQQIVQAHKGKIWAESKGEGKGSTFFVELQNIQT